jgi:hypothetical protein
MQQIFNDLPGIVFWEKTALSFFIALLGMLAHAVKKYLRKEIDDIYAWFILDTRTTLNAIFAVAAGVLTLAFTMGLETLPFSQFTLQSFLVGYALDSTVNKMQA